MKKSAANEGRSAGSVRAALALALLLFGHPAKIAAAERGRWPHATYYTVVARPGDTVGTMAGRYCVLPSLIVRLSGLKSTDPISAGRVIVIPAGKRATREAVLSEAIDHSAPNYTTRPRPLAVARSAFSVAPATKPVVRPQPHPANEIQAAVTGKPKVLRFAWPIAGSVISSFGPGANGTRNDGINIAAERGSPFRAAAGGTVSYAGQLEGYGNLILITHSHGYVTAYAHADNITVVRGEAVERSEIIGTAGTSGGVDQPQLHFEIRRGVMPVNPISLLAANS